MKASLLALMLLSSVPVNAHEFRTRSVHSQVCSQLIYKEQYIPGTSVTPGYVKSWKESYMVPCYRASRHNHYRQHYFQPRSNYKISRSSNQTISCNSVRTTTGGLLGGGLAAVLSKKDAYAWSVPLGAVVGMGVANADC